MPPSVALVLCTLFVLLVLRFAGERITSGSLALWLPTIWISYCASRPVANWFTSGSLEASRIEEGSGTDRFLLALLIVFCFVILKRRRVNWSEVFRENRWLMLLCAYAALSIFWSDYSWVSLKRWFRFCGTPLMALIVLTEVNPGDAMERVLRRTAYLLIPFSLLLIKYFPDLGVQYDLWTGQRMWVGVTTQKNELGRLSLISAFFLVWTIIRAWPHRKSFRYKTRIRTDLMVLVLALLLLKGPGGNYSATSVVSLLLGVITYIFLLRVRRSRTNVALSASMAVVVIAVVLGISIPIIGASGLSGVVGALGRDTTFTGRTEIWQAVLPVALHNPIFGVGYGSFWINPPIHYDLFIMVNEAHNGYLDLFTELGVVGLILFLGFLLSTFRQAQKAMAYDFEWAAFAFCFLLITVVHNITESSFLRPTNHMGAIMFFLAMFVHRLRARADDRGHEQATNLAIKASSAA